MMRHVMDGFRWTGLKLGYVTLEVRSLHAAAYVLGTAAFLSSLLALARDRILAHLFGAGLELDLYFAAFRIPDLLFVSIGALVSVYVLIPMLAARDEKEQHRYIDTVAIGFSLLAIAAAAAAALLAPRILGSLFPQYAAEGHLDTLIMMTRILLLQPILLGFSNIAAAITQFKHRYVLYAATPIVYNFGIIAGAVFLYPLWGLSGLAWGVVLGALLHVGIQVPSVVRDGFLRSFAFSERGAFASTVIISAPRALALSMTQITFIGFIALAGLMATGSIAIFMFAWNLQAVPLAIIGASYSVAAFPSLSRMFAEGKIQEFVVQVSTAARHVIFWSFPATALLIVLRAHVVRSILGSGQFDWADTRLTAAALALFGVSLTAQGLTLLLIRGYYASGRTLIPVSAAAATAAAALGLALFFVDALRAPAAIDFLESLLRVEGVAGSSVLALPLAFSVASVFGVLFLIIDFERRFGGFVRRIADVCWQSLVAAFAAGVVAYIALVFMGPLELTSTLASVFTKGFVAGCAGIAAAVAAYYISGSRELAEGYEAARRRLWRSAEPYSSVE
ncbi:hypothetical protein COU20_02110 [Candidatus Kaiserbacteria bacterium CG10_big_fil_rev_8_21_14_0_10_59_10]|uniref:Lipid II flippase MurJ n=1 Tax=Candidatus Kaiserbacteria bacterium CG10_big_fil_rev_8_21_14_0_10_59_10 TaxID=1974612 RepID=A0A2H0U7S7_9BACT|nr:MAG: hypothetical protein COU20_02110 [Candidatus Kaiserbacteria bacterium CG10_big_fil_rev_8_21_14_0_10_59_10]